MSLIDRAEKRCGGRPCNRKRLVDQQPQALEESRLSGSALGALNGEVWRRVEEVVDPGVSHPKGRGICLSGVRERDVPDEKRPRLVQKLAQAAHGELAIDFPRRDVVGDRPGCDEAPTSHSHRSKMARTYQPV